MAVLLFLLLILLPLVLLDGISGSPQEPRPPTPPPGPETDSPRSQFVGSAFAARTGHPSECQVCGASLETDVVSCPNCATLHHEECWAYNRGCSTYGCTRA